MKRLRIVHFSSVVTSSKRTCYSVVTNPRAICLFLCSILFLSASTHASCQNKIKHDTIYYIVHLELMSHDQWSDYSRKVTFDLSCEVRDIERQIRKHFKKAYTLLPIKEASQNKIAFTYRNGVKHYDFCDLNNKVIIMDATWCTYFYGSLTGKSMLCHSPGGVGTRFDIKAYLIDQKTEVYFEEKEYSSNKNTFPAKQYPALYHAFINPPGHRRFFNRRLKNMRKWIVDRENPALV
jgi:hypothetical protein